MTWYDPRTWGREKLNPAQEIIAREEGTNLGSDASYGYTQAFTKLESVNRGVSMITAACASLDYDVKEKIREGLAPGIKLKQLHILLNHRPNPYQSLIEFRTALFTDFLLEGNAFIYFDGAHLYHLPAASVEIVPHSKTYIAGFTYGEKDFGPEEIVYFKDVSTASIYRGTSRLQAADRNIKVLYKMQEFQEGVFANGAIPNMVLLSDNSMSPQAKERTINNWISRFTATLGARRPIILDNGLKPYALNNLNFKELDFDISVKSHNIRILETLGVPPVLLDGGNQANISPNLRLFYLETVLPIVRKYMSAMELLSGYDIDAITSNVSAIQPELKDLSDYYTSLTNAGLLSPNESREALRYPKDTDPESDKLRVPKNIAGSAVDPSQGGAPKKPDEN